MRFFLLAFLFTLLTWNVLANDCDSSCTMDYTPVCAGSPPQTFSNACALDIHNCKNKAAFQIIKHGEC